MATVAEGGRPFKGGGPPPGPPHLIAPSVVGGGLSFFLGRVSLQSWKGGGNRFEGGPRGGGKTVEMRYDEEGHTRGDT